MDTFLETVAYARRLTYTLIAAFVAAQLLAVIIVWS